MRSDQRLAVHREKGLRAWVSLSPLQDGRTDASLFFLSARIVTSRAMADSFFLVTSILKRDSSTRIPRYLVGGEWNDDYSIYSPVEKGIPGVRSSWPDKCPLCSLREPAWRDNHREPAYAADYHWDIL